MGLLHWLLDEMGSANAPKWALDALVADRTSLSLKAALQEALL